MADKPVLISDPLKATIARIEEKRQRMSVEDHAQAVAQEIRREIAPDGKLPAEQAWMNFAPMPTDMCRVSPFFPMGTKEMASRTLIRGMVIAKSAWGEVTYSGPKLSVFEEDVLLAILALLKGVEPEEIEGKPAWTYAGPLRPILTALGYKATGKRNYERIRAALELLAMAVVRIQTKRGKWELVNMITRAGGDESEATVAVTVNPFFAEMYAAGAVNLLDLAKRSELLRPVSKALHRFATSHRGDWQGHFLTLAAAINLDLEQPHFEIRRQIRQAMSELRKAGVIGRRGKFVGDIVTLAEPSRKPKEITP